MLCFLLGLGTHITSLSNHRIEWLCGILSEIDAPIFICLFTFLFRPFGHSISPCLIQIMLQNEKLTVFETLTNIPPDWIIRSIRRRILFGQIPLQPIPSKNRAILRNEEFSCSLFFAKRRRGIGILFTSPNETTSTFIRTMV